MLYYAKGPFKSSIWKMPVNGGPETEVVQSIIGFAFAVAKTGLYFERVESDGRTSIQFLSFSTGNTNIVSIRPSSVKDAPLGYLSVSPDEHYLLYTQTDQEGSDLMLVENFR